MDIESDSYFQKEIIKAVVALVVVVILGGVVITSCSWFMIAS